MHAALVRRRSTTTCGARPHRACCASAATTRSCCAGRLHASRLGDVPCHLSAVLATQARATTAADQACFPGWCLVPAHWRKPPQPCGPFSFFPLNFFFQAPQSTSAIPFTPLPPRSPQYFWRAAPAATVTSGPPQTSPPLSRQSYTKLLPSEVPGLCHPTPCVRSHQNLFRPLPPRCRVARGAAGGAIFRRGLLCSTIGPAAVTIRERPHFETAAARGSPGHCGRPFLCLSLLPPTFSASLLACPVSQQPRLPADPSSFPPACSFASEKIQLSLPTSLSSSLEQPEGRLPPHASAVRLALLSPSLLSPPLPLTLFVERAAPPVVLLCHPHFERCSFP